MYNDFKIFVLSFIPIFVAIDVLGLVPIFLSLTSDMKPPEKKKLITDATFTALAVSLVFLFGGRLIFNFMGITENDFRVGGGIVLLVLAVIDLTFTGDKTNRAPQTSVGVVPIGIPLIIGPAGTHDFADYCRCIWISCGCDWAVGEFISCLADFSEFRLHHSCYGRSRIESICKSSRTFYGSNCCYDDPNWTNRNDHGKINHIIILNLTSTI